MSKSALVVVNAFFLVTVPAIAQDCSKAITQPELNKCAEAEYKSADKKLNIIYDNYRNVLNEEEKNHCLYCKNSG
jgi:uncharacterized protein YecT (DUF1311 family)